MGTTLRTMLEETRALDPRPRGKQFEKFLGQVFEDSGIRRRLSYRPEGEEIDGAFWWGQRTFLLEAKWWSEPLPASSIYAFKGKVDGKFADTLGIFVSMSGYSTDCVQAVTHGKSLNILLFDDSDVEAIADGTDFDRVLEEKMFVAGQSGQIYVPWSDLVEANDFVSEVQTQASAALESGKKRGPLIVVCEGKSDKQVIASLIEHVARQRGITATPQFFISRGKAPLLDSIAPSLASLLSNSVSGPADFLVVFDADTKDSRQVEQQRVRARKIIADLPQAWRGHVSIAVPEIEEWLGLRKRLDPSSLSSHLAGLDWDQQAARNSEIGDLIVFLNDTL